MIVHRLAVLWMLTLALAVVVSAAEPQAQVGTPPRLAQIEDFAPPEEFIDIGGLKTHFVHKGELGRVIVLLHGFGSSTYTWRLNLDEFSKKYRVYAIDIKGFGLTAKPRDGNYHVGAYADHLLGFLDAMKIDKATIAGNSMGGAVALNLALRHPNRVEGLVLVDAAPLDYEAKMTSLRPKMETPNNERTEPETQSVLKMVLTRALVNKSFIEAGLKGAYHHPEAFVTPEMIDKYHQPLLIDGALEALAAMGWRPRTAPIPPIGTLKIPVLIIWGRHDQVIPVAVADTFVKSIPGSKKVVLEESGHLPHEEEAKTFNRLVTEFVADLPIPPVVDALAPAKP